MEPGHGAQEWGLPVPGGVAAESTWEFTIWLPHPCLSLGYIFFVRPSVLSPWHQPSPMGSLLYLHSALLLWHWTSNWSSRSEQGSRRKKQRPG